MKIGLNFRKRAADAVTAAATSALAEWLGPAADPSHLAVGVTQRLGRSAPVQTVIA
jgi:hypothetical protein